MSNLQIALMIFDGMLVTAFAICYVMAVASIIQDAVANLKKK